MPEMPEVETIKRQLVKKIVGKKIKSVEVKEAKLVNLGIREFKKGTAGMVIKGVLRRAKLLIWKLGKVSKKSKISKNWNLVFHLKLTGQVIWAGESIQPEKSTYIIFNLSDGNRIFFNDQRKFGWLKLVDNKDLEKMLNEFGPEVLDKSFTLDKFKDLLKKRKKSKIKPLLMDQGFIAGVGNIYSQEACFCAGVHPERKVKDLVDKEIGKLYNCLKKVLIDAVKFKGSSVDAYVDVYGQKGKFVPRLKVYGRGGLKCYKCRAEIRTKKIGGRGTSFCEKCQR